MDESSHELSDNGPLARRRTRRVLLAGAAAVAAGGAAAGVTVLARTGTEGEGSPGSTAAEEPGAAMPTPTPDQDRPIEATWAQAAHLLRRAGWGGSLAEIEAFEQLEREDAVDRLLGFETVDNASLDARLAKEAFNLTTPGRGLDGKRAPLIRDMQRWWLTRMAYTARPLEERMTYTWHGLLTSQVSQVGIQAAKQMVRQNELFRAHALGRYDDLLQAVSKDAAMMLYLNTIESTKAHPNENYARELMELFSMGEGNYTEEDVRESARAFTGWRLTRPARDRPPEGLSERERDEWLNQMWAAWEPEFRLEPRLHDADSKTFLGETGSFGGEDIVRIIMEQPATGRFITRRLFSELAYRDPDDKTIDRLVEVWDASGHSVREVVRAILLSDEFWSMRAYRSLVRSPVEFAVGAVRALGIETNWQTIEQSAAGMDQRLFEPPSVAGWPGGEAWLSSGTFFGRVNFLDAFLFPRGRPIAIPSLEGQATIEDMVDTALKALVDDDIAEGSREALYAHAATVPAGPERAATVAYLVLASPEYQLV